MKKIIALYVLMIIAIAFIAVWVGIRFDFLSAVYFPKTLHMILEGTNSILMLLIFLVSNYIYSRTKDERLIILAGGFLIGAIFNAVHTIIVPNFPYDLLYSINLKNTPIMLYLLLGNLVLPLSIYFALVHKPPKVKIENFRSRTYGIYLGIFLILAILPYLLSHFLPKLQMEILMLVPSLEFINYSLYIMLAFIVINIRQSSNLTFFPAFTTGLVVSGLGGLFYLNTSAMPVNEIFAHILQLVGLVFMLAGIPKLITYSLYLRFKDELVAHLCLMLVVFYFSFISIATAFFNMIFPAIYAYIFVEFILIFQFIVYLIANSITQPITEIIKALETYTPGEAYLNLPVIRHDEVGQLTAKINAISLLSWKKILEISKIAEREHSVIRIFESMRRVSNQNVIKNSIVEEVTRALNPDRIFIALYDSSKDSFYFDKYLEGLPSKAYLAFCDGNEVEEEKEEEIMLKKLNEFLKNNLELCFSNVEDYIVTNSLGKTQKETLLKEYKVKSCCNIPIYYAGQLLACLVIQYTENYKQFDNIDLSYLKMMATQLGIAINQSNL